MREPSGDAIERHIAELARRGGPAGQDRILDVSIVWPERPIGPALHHAITDRLKSSHRDCRRLRPQRRTKALVPALVPIDRRHHFGVERIARLKRGAAVIAERRIDRQPASRGLDRQPFEPWFGNQIEQRRAGDEIERPVEHELEIAGKIDRPRLHAHMRRLRQRDGAGQKAEIVVDEPPALPGREPRPDCPHACAGPAGEIDDRDRRLIAKGGGDRLEHGCVTGAQIIGLA